MVRNESDQERQPFKDPLVIDVVLGRLSYGEGLFKEPLEAVLLHQLVPLEVRVDHIRNDLKGLVLVDFIL